MSGWLLLLVAVAGGAGSALRYAVDSLIRARCSPSWPWATVVINLLGSMLLGLFTGLLPDFGTAGHLRVVLGAGLCGGFTTFSTAMVDAVRLAQQGRAGTATLNTLSSLGCAAATAGIGYWLGTTWI